MTEAESTAARSRRAQVPRDLPDSSWHLKSPHWTWSFQLKLWTSCWNANTQNRPHPNSASLSRGVHLILLAGVRLNSHKAHVPNADLPAHGARPQCLWKKVLKDAPWATEVSTAVPRGPRGGGGGKLEEQEVGLNKALALFCLGWVPAPPGAQGRCRHYLKTTRASPN